jgi:hypothetical protein
MFMYSYRNVYVFLLLCMVYSVYSVSVCCSVYCLCVNVYCTTATGCQPKCSQQIYKYQYATCFDVKKVHVNLTEY